jgi:hypothetical protein
MDRSNGADSSRFRTKGRSQVHFDRLAISLGQRVDRALCGQVRSVYWRVVRNDQMSDLRELASSNSIPDDVRTKVELSKPVNLNRPKNSELQTARIVLSRTVKVKRRCWVDRRSKQQVSCFAYAPNKSRLAPHLDRGTPPRPLRYSD